MVKKWYQFIREFVETSDNVIDIKMQEIKTLIDNISDGNNFIYEWENKNDHQLLINFNIHNLSIRYEFDIDDLRLSKTAGQSIDFTEDVDSIGAGLDMIEKDIQLILGISK